MTYPGLTAEKWNNLTKEAQLGNLGAEILRSINRNKQKDLNSASLSFERALTLIDFTIADPKWRQCLKELVRLREVFCARFFQPGEYLISDKQLTDYFLPFACLARKQ